MTARGRSVARRRVGTRDRTRASIVVYDAAYYPTIRPSTWTCSRRCSKRRAAGRLGRHPELWHPRGRPHQLGANEQQIDSDFTTPGVTFLAASGDSGIFGNGGDRVDANYPAASPDVVAVGGTAIVIDSSGDYPGTGPSGEVGWGDGTTAGGRRRRWRLEHVRARAGLAKRRCACQPRFLGLALPDVAMDSGMLRNTTSSRAPSRPTPDSHRVGRRLARRRRHERRRPDLGRPDRHRRPGTGVAGGTPLTGYSQTLPALYSLPAADFHDIVNGNNGDPAVPGYDLVTGRGTPVANLLFPTWPPMRSPASWRSRPSRRRMPSPAQRSA